MNKLFLLVTVLFVGVAIGGGLMVAGGPAHARFEKEDLTRYVHLEALGRYYACDLYAGKTPERICSSGSRLPDAPERTKAEEYIFLSTGRKLIRGLHIFQDKCLVPQTPFLLAKPRWR